LIPENKKHKESAFKFDHLVAKNLVNRNLMGLPLQVSGQKVMGLRMVIE
jgi:hypothetical protein